MILELFLTIIAYFIGSLPFAYMIGKRYGKDLLSEGSKHSGMVNAWKLVSWKVGVLILFLDGFKGAIVMIGLIFLSINNIWSFVIASSVIVGHNWSVFLKFSGGKGVATAFGLSLVVAPWLTIASLITIPTIFWLSRSIVYAFGATFLVLNTLVYFFAPEILGLCVWLSVLVVGTHIYRTKSTFIPALFKLDWKTMGGDNPR